MKLKTSTLYQIRSLSISTGLFFGIMILILGILHLSIMLTSSGGLIDIKNIDVKWIDLTFTFVVISALVTSIRSDFKYFIQNGCSRMTIFNGSNLSYLFISIVSAALVVLIHIPKLRVGTETMFQMFYGNNVIEQFFWTTIFSFMMCVIFFLLSNISALLSRKQNLILGAVVAVFSIAIIPSLSLLFPDWNVIQSLVNIMQNFFGMSLKEFVAIKAITNFSIVIVVVSLVNLILIRRIQVFD